jgi:tetratricopeptide (TPR) repeat protein
MLEHEQHILSVDLLFDDEQIGDFVKSIQIDSPYQQMLLEGVLTESVHDEKLFVSFTVEGYFHFVLGEVIYNRTEGLGAEALKQIVEENKLNGTKEGVEQCLNRDVQKNDLTRLEWLIDDNGQNNKILITPIISALKAYGVEKTTNKLLENITDNDWNLLLEVLNELIVLQLYLIRDNLIIKSNKYNLFNSKSSFLYGLKAIGLLNEVEEGEITSRIDFNLPLILEDYELLFEVGVVTMYRNNKYALICLEKCLSNCIEKFGENSTNAAKIYDELGLAFEWDFNNEKSIWHLNKSLEIKLNNYGLNHYEVAYSYYIIGCTLVGQFDYLGDNLLEEGLLHLEKSVSSLFDLNSNDEINLKTLALQKMASVYQTKNMNNYAMEKLGDCLDLVMKIKGKTHIMVAELKWNIASLLIIEKKYNQAFNLYDESLSLFRKIEGENSENALKIYYELAEVNLSLLEFETALHYYKICLTISTRNYGELNTFNAELYHRQIATCLMKLKKYDDAIYNLSCCVQINQKNNYLGDFPIYFFIAQCHDALGKKAEALSCFIKSIEIWKEEDGECEYWREELHKSIVNLAIELSQYNQLPQWIKELKDD